MRGLCSTSDLIWLRSTVRLVPHFNSTGALWGTEGQKPDLVRISYGYDLRLPARSLRHRGIAGALTSDLLLCILLQMEDLSAIPVSGAAPLIRGWRLSSPGPQL